MAILESSVVEFHTQGTFATEEDVLKVIQSHIIPALVPGSMPVYARHRWLGGEASVDYVGLLECHHKLFSTTVLRMFKAQKLAAQPVQEPAAAEPAAAEPAPAGWAAMAAEVLGSAGDDDGNPLALLDGEIPGEAPSTKDEEGWAAFNRSMQKKMRAWAADHDLSVLALMRRVLTISSRVFFAMLKRSGAQWDHDQGQALLNGQPRSYRLTDALLSKDMDVMMDAISGEFHKSTSAVPLQSMTIHIACQTGWCSAFPYTESA